MRLTMSEKSFWRAEPSAVPYVTASELQCGKSRKLKPRKGMQAGNLKDQAVVLYGQLRQSKLHSRPRISKITLAHDVHSATYRSMV